MQTVAAIRYVTNGSYSATFARLRASAVQRRNATVDGPHQRDDQQVRSLHQCGERGTESGIAGLRGTSPYEMAAVCIMSHLIIQDATKAPELFGKSALVYVNYAEAEVENTLTSSVSSRQKSWKATANKRIAWTRQI